jgi:hypothetical protein
VRQLVLTTDATEVPEPRTSGLVLISFSSIGLLLFFSHDPRAGVGR